MSSDIAIAQFRFLERLLLVHGHWCYRRMSSMVTINAKVQSLDLQKHLFVIGEIHSLSYWKAKNLDCFLAPCHFRPMDLLTYVLLISINRSAISSTRTLPLASRSSTSRPMPHSLEKLLTMIGISRFTTFSSPHSP